MIKLYIYNRHCVEMGRWVPKGEWKYDNITRQIRSTKVDKCVVTDGQRLSLEPCADNSTIQQWTWKETYLV